MNYIRNQISKMNNIIKQKQAQLDCLFRFISDNKKSKFEEFIQYRTKYLTVVLEDIYQSQNASAVLRTCDCVGIQDVHIIENKNDYTLNPEVELGAAKWLNLKKYNQDDFNTINAFDSLKKQGYKIIATTPHKHDQLLTDLKLDGKMALVFGTEKQGLSEQAIEAADEFVRIPMHGFTESFNISVSAAICLFHIMNKVRDSDINWMLTEEERLDTLVDWAKSVVKNSDGILKQLNLS